MSDHAPEVRRSQNPDTPWVLVAIALIAGILIGYLGHPVISGPEAEGSDSREVLSKEEPSGVEQSISTALTPVTQALDEIRASLNPADGNPANGSTGPGSGDVARLFGEVQALQILVKDQNRAMEQLIRNSDADTQASLGALAAQTGERLQQLDELGATVDQLAAKMPELLDSVQTLRPVTESGTSETVSLDSVTGDSVTGDSVTGDSAAEDTVAEDSVTTDSVTVFEAPLETGPTGTLNINNTSDQAVTILINGESRVLSPGENSFVVPRDRVEVRHPASGTVWNLDPSLWEMTGDRYMINRKWVF